MTDFNGKLISNTYKSLLTEFFVFSQKDYKKNQKNKILFFLKYYNETYCGGVEDINNLF